MLPMVLIAAAAGKGISEIPTVQDLGNLTSLLIGAGGNRPQVSIRLTTDGKIQTATGDTGTALSYSDIGFWLDTDTSPASAADWEVKLTEDSAGGTDLATWTGAATGSFHALSTTRTFTLTKDDSTVGDAIENTTLEVRQVSSTTNNDTKATVNTVEITL